MPRVKSKEAVLKEKEREERLRELRRDLETRLEEQLPEEITDSGLRVDVQKIDESEIMQPEKAKQVIEALLFASSKPLTVGEIRRVLKRLAPREIHGYIAELQTEYATTARSFHIQEVAGGYELSTRREFAPWICKIEMQKKARQATQSALETLAILAYKQPITRAEIEELRGVDASGVINTLVGRSLIRIVGRKEVPGRPFLYGTTEKFLEHFGLKSLKDLPDIEEIHKLVETSVRKEDLLGHPQMVAVEHEAAEGEAVKGTEQETVPGEKIPANPPEEGHESEEPQEEAESKTQSE